MAKKTPHAEEAAGQSAIVQAVCFWGAGFAMQNLREEQRQGRGECAEKLEGHAVFVEALEQQLRELHESMRWLRRTALLVADQALD